MVLYSKEKVVIAFSDGLPNNDGYETIYGKFTPDAVDMASDIDLRPILKELIRSYPIWEPAKEKAAPTCADRMREAMQM